MKLQKKTIAFLACTAIMIPMFAMPVMATESTPLETLRIESRVPMQFEKTIIERYASASMAPSEVYWRGENSGVMFSGWLQLDRSASFEADGYYYASYSGTVFGNS